MVESAADLLEELGPLQGSLAVEATEKTGNGTRNLDGLDAEYLLLLENLGHDPVAPDDLIRRTGLPAQSIASMLLLLELEGYVSSSPGGRYCRRA